MLENSLKKDQWLMRQTWEHLVFIHWPVSASFLESIIPFPLKPDTYNGEAWIGIVPFKVSHMRVRGLPEVPLLSKMTQINVRTYVTYKGTPGVYFFSLDVNHFPSMLMARSFLHLPYLNASISLKKEKQVWQLHFQRRHRGAPPVYCELNYWPEPEIFFSKKGSIEHWLTERYTLFAPVRGHLYRGDLRHLPWPLQKAQCELPHDTLTAIYKRPKQSYQWLAHYSENMEAKLMSYRKVY